MHTDWLVGHLTCNHWPRSHILGEIMVVIALQVWLLTMELENLSRQEQWNSNNFNTWRIFFILCPTTLAPIHSSASALKSSKLRQRKTKRRDKSCFYLALELNTKSVVSCRVRWEAQLNLLLMTLMNHPFWLVFAFRVIEQFFSISV